ncbi:uncharacterized protein H6S33_012614 [Morchella sextelata]|uniref:uncharacterized protein n=1 Tax=Morchella sextelata TaxID=1174677 RepID=UPI001D03F171|nr:uncharacterized protein H6S33_012614 [Morchella sextelata]KAH0610068.1 hypothetical protein H6S33_012614 [Morchella sextelata]
MKRERTSTSRSPSSDGAETAMGEIKLEDSPRDIVAGGKILRMGDEIKEEKKKGNGSSKASSASPAHGNTPSSSPTKGEEDKGSPAEAETGDSQKPKLLRAPSSTKVLKEKKPPALFNDYPDSTEEATSTFAVIDACIYSNKHIGDSGQDGDGMSCECREEWDGTHNVACGENSDCINRMTSMECTQDDSSCGSDCQNKRFQKRQYANVSVIKTEKKGFGLRANVDIPINTFLYEYVGEVIDEGKFRRRTHKYFQEGIKHFYFMSLGKNEFIDATKKGGLARFCNHSCNPNCFIDKWVVGDKLRMGIFSKRDIIAGEELVFDYNVDRYGAEPQTCFCQEPNCLGYIGGKTQTDAAPKLSHNIIEALGLEDSEDWVTATAKKGRRPKKTGEDDDDYTESGTPGTRPMSEADVTKVMSSLLHCKEKWIITKLLDRIIASEDDAVFARIVKMHGYQILGRIIQDTKDDMNVVLTALRILFRFPRITKNKITQSKIETIVVEFTTVEDEQVREASNTLIQEWSSLETGFRIPRRAPTSTNDKERNNAYNDRDNRDSRSKSGTPPPDRTATPPTRPRPQPREKSFQSQPPRGPRADRAQYSNNNDNKPRRDIPWGWHKAWHDQQLYYYSNDGRTRWDMPTEPCRSDDRPLKPPPPPLRHGELPLDPKRNALQAIIDSITQNIDEKKVMKVEKAPEETEKKVVEVTEQQKRRSSKDRERKEKERREKVYDDDKTKNILMKTFAKVVANAVSKYTNELGGRDAVKKHAKDITEILVKKEMKDGRKIVNPHLLLESEKRRGKVKIFVKQYIEKVIHHIQKEKENKAKRDQHRKDRKERSHGSSSSDGKGKDKAQNRAEGAESVDSQMMDIVQEMSPIGGSVSPTRGTQTPPCLTPGKRRRDDSDDGDESGRGYESEERQSPKRAKPTSPRRDMTPPANVTTTEFMAGGGGVYVC